MSNLSIISVLILMIAVMCLYLGISVKLISLGKKKLPGAKKRRKKFLWLFYGPKSIFKKNN